MTTLAHNDRARWGLPLYLAGVAVVSGALGYVTVLALRLEDARAQAEAQARDASAVRLALWRMDSFLAPLLARESARPWLHYQALYPTTPPSSADAPRADDKAQFVAVSPLLEFEDPLVRLHYQQTPEGLTSPQVPAACFDGLVPLDHARLLRAADDLDVVRALLSPEHPLLADSAPSGTGEAALSFGRVDSVLTEESAAFNSAGVAASPPPVTASAPPPTSAPAQVGSRVSAPATDRVETLPSPETASVETFGAPNTAPSSPDSPTQAAPASNASSAWQQTANDFQARQQLRDELQSANVVRAVNQWARPRAEEPSVPGAADRPGAGEGHDPAAVGEPALAASVAADVAPRAAPPPAPPPPAAAAASPAESKSAQKPGAPEPAAKRGRTASAPSRQAAAPAPPVFVLTSHEPDAEVTPMSARWIDPAPESGADPAPESGAVELVLERRVIAQGSELTQGVWLNWPVLHAQLVESVQDLLPAARLAPAPASLTPDLQARLLAQIPAVLEPGPIPAPEAARSIGLSPIRATLAAAWAALIVAALAVGLSLRTSARLAERRGRFVSAVTHELRTPLTSFQLYSQMLADGLVTDEVVRARYLRTLHAESLRLGRIVETVLDYARLGSRRAAPPSDPTPVSDLVDRAAEAARARLQSGGMNLVIDQTPIGAEASLLVRCDASAVEQIVVNLADNAVKYAAPRPPDSAADSAADPAAQEPPAADPRAAVRFSACVRGRRLEISIRDHGPGIPDADRRLLFKTFQRGSSLAQANVPGLGLGLALSRELARRMGGELVLATTSADGSEFRLTLPIA